MSIAITQAQQELDKSGKRHLYLVGLPGGLHPRSHVHSVAEEAVPRRSQPHNPGSHRARVEADPCHHDLLRPMSQLEVRHKGAHLQRDVGDVLHMGVADLPRHPRDNHVRVADGLHLIGVVLGDDGIEAAEEVVEEVDELEWARRRGDAGEAANVPVIDRLNDVAGGHRSLTRRAL